MEEEWIYLINAILNTTENSFVKGVQISKVHYNALVAGILIPFILALKNSYEPIHLNYLAKYDAWISQGGIQGGETLSLRQLLRLLSNTKIKKWDVAIQNIYPNDTARYKALLPHFRIPFQTGKQNDKIAAVNALKLAIGTDSALTDVKDDVILTHGLLVDAQNSQQVNISQTSVFSQQLEIARVAMATAQYSNLGMFMHQYASNPSQIASYFDIKNIRRHHQVVFSGSELKSLIAYCICKHTFGKDDEVRITNFGLKPLKFYLVELKGNRISELFYLSESGTSRVIKANEMGDLSDKFVMVYNPSEDTVGEWEFELL